MNREAVAEVLSEAKAVGRKYRALTGKPLGITGEIAEFTAAALLGLELAEARQAGFDAVRCDGDTRVRVQIKGRCIPANANPGQRIGSIRLDQEWDTVLLVLLDMDFEPIEMREADRTAVTGALLEPGSKARNERGQLGVTKFRSISRRVWCRNGT